MSDSISTPAPHAPVHPPVVGADDGWPWGVLLAAMLLLLYFVGVDEGATSVVPGTALHEWVHDGRHLLGFACH